MLLPQRRHPRLVPELYQGAGVVVSTTVCVRDKRRLLITDCRLVRAIVEQLERLHGKGWAVLAYCVMPDHVHVLVESRGDSIVEFMHRFKGRTARAFRELGYRRFWQPSFYDHIVRGDEGIDRHLLYVLDNPVRAGFVDRWQEYPWCGSLEWPRLGSDVAPPPRRRVNRRPARGRSPRG